MVDEDVLVAALRRGDERAFAALVDAVTPVLRRVVRGYLRGTDGVDDVVQETWLAVLVGLDRFEGRSALRTWVVGIGVNVARRHAARAARLVPVAAVGEQGRRPAFAPGSFQGPDGADPGHWLSAPPSWRDLPEDAALAAETLAAVGRALEALPPAQRAGVTLRDVEGWTGPEVAAALGLTEANQRVLLHRGRLAVRRALEPVLSTPEEVRP